MWIKHFAIFLILFLLIFSCSRKTSEAPVVAPAKEAIIEFLTGDVLVDNTEAKIGDKIGNKALIAVGQGASCEIVFDDKNIISIAENTVFELDFSKINKSIDMRQGAITHVLKKLSIATDSDSFTVKTSTAVFGVRGTSFYVKTDPETTYVCVCNGVVTLKDSENGNNETVKAKHHDGRLFTKTESGIKMAPSAMLYHTDADVERAAAKIGYQIDWEKIE